MGKFGYLSPAVSEISAWGKHHIANEYEKPAVSEISAWGKHHIAEKNKAKVLKKVM